MIEELKDGIETKGLALSGLDSSNFAYDKIQTVYKRPYVTFFSLPSDYTFDSGHIWELANVQFSVFGKSIDAVHDLADTIKTAFDFCTDISMTNYGLNKCVREGFFINRHLDIWQAIITYNIEIEIAR